MAYPKRRRGMHAHVPYVLWYNNTVFNRIQHMMVYPKRRRGMHAHVPCILWYNDTVYNRTQHMVYPKRRRGMHAHVPRRVQVSGFNSIMFCIMSTVLLLVNRIHNSVIIS